MVIQADPNEIKSLKTTIKELEKQLSSKYYQFGKDLYEMTNNENSEINRIVDELLDKKITLKIKLANLKINN